LLERWDEKYGVVIIGIDMDWDLIEETLDQCLLTLEELESDWSLFEDPLPAFEESVSEVDKS
jgi:hypothetical protein